MPIKRKSIHIYAFDFEPTVIVTYNIGRYDTVDDLMFWVRADKLYDFSVTRRVLDMINELEVAEPFSEFLEKDVFRAYQNAFDVKSLTQNYKLKTETFKIEKLAKTMIPKRDFVLVTKETIYKNIEDYIKRRKK